jgi:PAS domain S-box-containing protein/diguanylate cyclase (GGDEF)-like protein
VNEDRPRAVPHDELPDDVYRVIVEQARVGVFVTQENRLLYVNAKVTELFGYQRAEMLAGLDPIALTAPGDRARVREQVQRRSAGLPSNAYDVQFVRKDGSVFDGRVFGTRVKLQGREAHVVTLHDISELKQIARAAEQRSQLLAQTEELARIGSSEYDIANGVARQSAGMFAIFGEPVGDAEVPGEWLMERLPASEQASVRAILENVQPDHPCEFEHRIVHTDGSLRTVLHRAIAEVDERGRTTRVVGILQDITAQRAAEQRLDLLSNTDEVTGLPNRAAFLDHLDAVLRQAQRDGERVVLMVLQIDQLALVGESLGYAGADKLLAQVGERLVHRPDGSEPLGHLAHLGSGEFALVLTHVEGPEDELALPAAQTVLEALATLFMVEAAEVNVTCSMGASFYPRDSDSAARLLQQAQAARHRAHELGDNRICAYTPDAHGKAVARLAMEAGLRRALARHEFHLRYQPQLDLTTGAVIGVEALLRWNDAANGPVSPADFIPLAEETGLILPIGEWALRTACEQNLAWQRAGLAPIRVAVNLSLRQLQQPDIARRIQAILHETRLEPRYLGLEITEGLLMQESAHVARMLGEIKALGVEISLDDFGTGYSNLNYLRTLPIDVVKVDRSFVHDVTAALHDVSMTRAVITLAHSLQMKVLAEGVETESQLSMLIANKCDQMQGYYFSPPVPAPAIAEMLQARRQLPERLLQRRARQRTLLLVDDEENILAALKRLLRRDGYHVVTASNGPQGLQRLAEHEVDVILSDQRMPGMTGVEFLRRAKELYPDTVRMVLSGYTELTSITDAINEGAIYKFLTKPWDDERLRVHIEEAFKHKEMADENRRLGGAVQAANQELAEVNERLQKLLKSQHDQINREETSLVVAREVLENIPAPVIGFDIEGMIAYLNADAELLFAHEPSLLGRWAEDALPAELVSVWRHGDGEHHCVDVLGHSFQAVCRTLHKASRSAGKLLVLAPALNTTLTH